MNDSKLEYFREYRRKNREKLRAYNREYNKAWRKKHGYHNEENSNKRYPSKVRARRILRYAVRRGIIKRGKCSVCKKENAQAHHEDYSQPLKVIWFCPLHHKEFHDLEREMSC